MDSISYIYYRMIESIVLNHTVYPTILAAHNITCSSGDVDWMFDVKYELEF